MFLSGRRNFADPVCARMGFWEGRAKSCSAAVTADHQVPGHIQLFDFERKSRSGRRFALVAHVTGQDDKGRIAEFCNG
ncbi:hypothetical protein RLO149_c008940 [Roseobacter litoralis Och 149]|uniref:Uncharacterized protein n=1 Tax=Roseobacter litoralis (strain ATCC 49566 / DSM 6996 / JCM 21268 / NBRC 15278 / OCh 149) TaxID=391595 RepID=F7Z9V8_ROSLO|nr:hypothetical protein RLO149_c008940 [Roseobacter litoralis Och 149]